MRMNPPSDSDVPHLDIDRPSTPPPGVPPAKSYKKLVQEVPHFTYASAAEKFPDLLADLQAGRDSPADPAQGQPHPPSFLTADDIDNYIWEIDVRLAEAEFAKTGKTPNLLPTLAPLAHPNDNASNGSKDNGVPPQSTNRDFALRNPTSVYNWLRKHAPKTFLQDGENEKDNGDEAHAPSSRGRVKGERWGRGGGSVRSKRASAAHRDKASTGEEFDEETGYDAVTPIAAGGKGKRKRVVDDDPGYRPKGGSSRPTKKKRKSEGAEGTPTAGTKRPRKSGLGGSTPLRDGDD